MKMQSRNSKQDLYSPSPITTQERKPDCWEGKSSSTMFYLYIYLFLKSFAKKGNNLIPGNIQKKDDHWYYMKLEHTQVTWPIF